MGSSNSKYTTISSATCGTLKIKNYATTGEITTIADQMAKVESVVSEDNLRKLITKVLLENPNSEVVELAESYLAQCLERSLKDTELNPVIQKFMDNLKAEITQKCDAVISEFEQRTREQESEVRNDLMELQSRIYQIEPMTQKNRDVIKYILEKIKDIRDRYQYDYELSNGY